MKPKHYIPPYRDGHYACGAPWEVPNKWSTPYSDEVTCGNCKRTKVYRNAVLDELFVLGEEVDKEKPSINRREKPMDDYQREFLDFALSVGVLRFGEFTLKSGRTSPYFFNAGLFNTGASLARLGRFYARAIIDAGIAFDILFGPAYKGIPLATVTAAALYDDHQLDVAYAFNRKELKDHGEGGTIVGHSLKGRVLIIDDVISAGVSVRESVDIIRAQGATPAGVVIALDRQEIGANQLSVIQEVEQQFSIPVAAITRLENLIFYLQERGDSTDILKIRKLLNELKGE